MSYAIPTIEEIEHIVFADDTTIREAFEIWEIIEWMQWDEEPTPGYSRIQDEIERRFAPDDNPITLREQIGKNFYKKKRCNSALSSRDSKSLRKRSCDYDDQIPAPINTSDK